MLYFETKFPNALVYFVAMNESIVAIWPTFSWNVYFQLVMLLRSGERWSGMDSAVLEAFLLISRKFLSAVQSARQTGPRRRQSGNLMNTFLIEWRVPLAPAKNSAQIGFSMKLTYEISRMLRHHPWWLSVGLYYMTCHVSLRQCYCITNCFPQFSWIFIYQVNVWYVFKLSKS